MKRAWAFFLAAALFGGSAAAQQAGPYAVHAEGVGAAPGTAVPSPGLPRVTLSLTNPALGQPAPAPGFFQSLGSGILRSVKQAAGNFLPIANFIPDGGPAPAPPALPPSLLPQAGNGFSQAPAPNVNPNGVADGASLADSLPRGAARSSTLGSPVLPGGIIPLRASQAEPMTVLHRTPLSLTAKAEALRAPLRNLAHLSAVPGDAGAERASRAGRQISDIVADDGSPSAAAGTAMPGPEAGQAMGDAELDSLRDAVAALPAPNSIGASVRGGEPPNAAGRDASAKAASAKGAPGLSEALDAASTYDGQALLKPHGTGQSSLPAPSKPAAPRFDLSLLVLHVLDSAVSFARAEEEALARRLRTLGAGAAAEPSGPAGRLVGPPAPAPTYALGSRGPAAGPGMEGDWASSAAGETTRARGEPGEGAFDLPQASSLPGRVPWPLAGSLLLPLIGVALFYLSELRRG